MNVSDHSSAQSFLLAATLSPTTANNYFTVAVTSPAAAEDEPCLIRAACRYCSDLSACAPQMENLKELDAQNATMHRAQVEYTCPLGMEFEPQKPPKIISGKCKTTDGSEDPGQPCVFPFVYNQTLYNGCTTAGSSADPWCSTALDARGVYVAGRWGTCEPACPAHVATSPKQAVSCEWSGQWSPSDQLGKCVCKCSLSVPNAPNSNDVCLSQGSAACPHRSPRPTTSWSATSPR